MTAYLDALATALDYLRRWQEAQAKAYESKCVIDQTWADFLWQRFLTEARESA